MRSVDDPPPLIFTSTNKVYGEMRDVQLRMNNGRYEPDDAGIRRHGFNEDRCLHFHSPYGCSKGCAEQYVLDYARTFGMRTVVFRMSCIYGLHQFGNEDQGWVAHFLYSALQKQPLTIYGDGKQVRDVLYVGDLLQAFEAVRTTTAAAGEIFNVGGGAQNTTSLLDMIRVIEDLTRAEIAYRFEPARPGDQLVYVTDHQKLTSLTDWAPQTTVDQILRHIQQWWKKNRSLFVMDEDVEPAASSVLAQEAA